MSSWMRKAKPPPSLLAGLSWRSTVYEPKLGSLLLAVSLVSCIAASLISCALRYAAISGVLPPMPLQFSCRMFRVGMGVVGVAWVLALTGDAGVSGVQVMHVQSDTTSELSVKGVHGKCACFRQDEHLTLPFLLRGLAQLQHFCLLGGPGLLSMPARMRRIRSRVAGLSCSVHKNTDWGWTSLRARRRVFCPAGFVYIGSLSGADLGFSRVGGGGLLVIWESSENHSAPGVSKGFWPI